MQVLFEVIANIMAFLYGLVPNYAVAIILLTLLVMVATTPLTLKSTRSMLEMQRLQPEMKRLQSQYKDDRQKLNEELLKFYKENDISPLGGCLPLLVQAPVFFVLYQVLHGLTLRVTDSGFNVGWVSGQLATGQPTSTPPTYARDFDPAYVSHDSQLYQNLSQSTTMEAFGLNLAESASQALQQGVLHALPYLLLIVIVGATGFIQQRQIAGRNQGNSQISSQQQMIMKIMPIFLPVISFSLPAGLVLYFAVSNIYRIGLQWFIGRSIYGQHKGAAGGGKDDGGKGGGGKPKGSGDPSTGKATAGRANGSGRNGGKAAVIDVEEVEADDAEATPARTARDRKRSGASRSDASEASPARTGDRSTAKTATKSPAKSPAKSTTKAPAKAATGSPGKTTTSKAGPKAKTSPGRAAPTKAGGKSSSGRTTPAKSTGGGANGKGRGGGSSRTGTAADARPTLQPRARKKKR